MIVRFLSVLWMGVLVVAAHNAEGNNENEASDPEGALDNSSLQEEEDQVVEDNLVSSEQGIEVEEETFKENHPQEGNITPIEEVEQPIERNKDLEEDSEDLSGDILTALGENNQEEKEYGNNIKVEIVRVTENILTDGLNKENREKIIKSTKVPVNCKLLDAPKLNPEFVGFLNNSTTSRDGLLKDRQQDLGRATGGISEAVNNLTKKDFDKLEVIKKLGDSMRLLANLHYQYTQIRRKLIAPFLDKSLTQNLTENKRSEFLYSRLEESVKTSSAMKRTMNSLKPKAKNLTTPLRPARNQTVKPHSNYKATLVQATTFKPPRNHPRPNQVKPGPGRRPAPANRGARARYP